MTPNAARREKTIYGWTPSNCASDCTGYTGNVKLGIKRNGPESNFRSHGTKEIKNHMMA